MEPIQPENLKEAGKERATAMLSSCKGLRKNTKGTLQDTGYSTAVCSRESSSSFGVVP
jgi:hypothetical protein